MGEVGASGFTPQGHGTGASIQTAEIDDGAVTVEKLESDAKTKNINFVIDGTGAVITTGIKGDVRIGVAGTIKKVTALSDQSGSIVVDIWKDSIGNFPPTDADSITASAPVTLSGATDSEDSTLTGWTTAITADDILRFNVDSITSCQRVTISLEVELA